MINKIQLKEIINDLIEVCNDYKFVTIINSGELKEGMSSCAVDLKTIFSEATQYHRGLMIEENRKNYYKNSPKEYPKKENKFEPITEPQLKFLKFNDKKLRDKGFDVDNIQSKLEAHKVIKQFKEMK